MGSPSGRNLKTLLDQLQSTEVREWPHHLGQAFKILAALTTMEAAKSIVVESAKAAYLCQAAISNLHLQNSQAGASADLHNACVRLRNCLAPRRLQKSKIAALDATARRSFVDDDVSTETISQFLLNCRDTFNEEPRNRHSSQALRSLGVLEDWQFGALECKRRGDPTLPIVTWYEGLPNELRLECETSLRQLAQRKNHDLEAREVFSLLATLTPQVPEASSIEIKDLLVGFVQKVAKLWMAAGLDVGRSNNEYNPEKLGPFPSFVERVLLSQFNTKHNFFERRDAERIFDAYEALPKDFRAAARNLEKPADRLIADWLLRTILRLATKKA